MTSSGKKPSVLERFRAMIGPPKETPQQIQARKAEAQADAVMGRQRKALGDELTQMRDAGAALKGPHKSERMLGQYLQQRAVLGKQVEGSQLATLRTGNQTVNQTRAKLSGGRGNVSTDVDRTDHESSRRTTIGRDIVKSLTNPEMSIERRGRISSSVAELCRAGNCGEHATVATHVQAGKLAEGQTVHKVGHATVDHAWTELRMRPGGTASDVIIDAWGKGPAVLREDSAFGHTVGQVKTKYSYNSDTGPEASRNATARAEALKNAPDWQAHVATRLQSLSDAGFQYSPKSVWAPTPVTSEAFSKEASDKRAALNKKNPVLREVLAAGVARNLGANVRQASEYAGTSSRKKWT